MNEIKKPDTVKGSSKQLLRRLKYEFLIETLVAVVCFCLAFGLTFKISIAIVLMCVKFGVPDFVTAYLVVRNDPDRWHGIGVALLFVATGFARSSGFAFTALLICACVLAPILNGWANPNLLFASLTTAAICAFGFLGLIFPLTFAAWLTSAVCRIRLSFARQLTVLRRSTDDVKPTIVLDIGASLGRISIISGFSVSVLAIGCLFIFAINGNVPDMATLVFTVSAFLLPFAWIAVFNYTVTPKY